MYRSMKRAIIAKLSRGGGGTGGASASQGGPATISGQFYAHRNLGRAVLPLVAVALPALPEEDDWTPDSNTGLLLSATSAAAAVAVAACGSRRPSFATGIGNNNHGASCLQSSPSNRQVQLSAAATTAHRRSAAESSFSGSDGRFGGGCDRRESAGFGSTADADVDEDDDDVDDDIASSDDIYRIANEE